MLIYCVAERRKTNTGGVTGHVAVNGTKYIKGVCMSCGNQKTRFVTDNQVAGEGLGSFFKKAYKKAAPVVKHVGKNILNNPSRAFELGQQAALAGMTMNPLAMGALAPSLGKFAVTGKGIPFSTDRFIRVNQVVPTENTSSGQQYRTKQGKNHQQNGGIARGMPQAYQFPKQTPAKKTKGKGLYL